MVTYLQAGGKQYTMKYTINALCAYEKTFGTSIVNALDANNISGLRNLLWAGLISEQPNISVEDTGNIMDEYLMDGKSITDISKEIIAALTDSGFFKKAGKPATAKGQKK